MPDMCVNILNRSKYRIFFENLKVHFLGNVDSENVKRKGFGQLFPPSFESLDGGTLSDIEFHYGISCCWNVGARGPPTEHEGQFASCCYPNLVGGPDLISQKPGMV